LNEYVGLTETASLKRIEFVYLAIFLVALVAIFALNYVAGGTITSPQNLAIDLASPPDSPQDWLVQNWPAVRYRALFRMIVRGSWSLFFAPNDAGAFYALFVGWSFLFFYGAVVAYYFFLRVLEFDRRASFIGGLLFLTTPPVLLAYKYPVYTREDVLAYLLVLLGLIAIFKSKPLLVCLISIAAALTRETTMIVPLAYFVATEEAGRKKFFVCAPPILAYIALRLLWGNAMHDPFESSGLTLEKPFETLAFLFCVFGALWLPYWLGLAQRWRKRDLPNLGWRVLTSAGPIVFVAVMVAALVLSRAREARITFILFPWAITFALDWLRNHSGYLVARARRFSFWIFALAILGTLSAIVLYFHLTNPELMRYYLVDFKNGYWLVVGTLHLSITLAIFLPLLRQQIASERTR